ncbi:hypothetical protein Hdeb2414_s0003g00108981 [Helianthus debilis subsp. tardiflorus]
MNKNLDTTMKVILIFFFLSLFFTFSMEFNVCLQDNLMFVYKICDNVLQFFLGMCHNSVVPYSSKMWLLFNHLKKG